MDLRQGVSGVRTSARLAERGSRTWRRGVRRERTAAPGRLAITVSYDLFAQSERLVLDRVELIAQTGVLSHSDQHASVGAAVLPLGREVVDLGFEVEKLAGPRAAQPDASVRNSANAPLVMQWRTAKASVEEPAFCAKRVG